MKPVNNRKKTFWGKGIALAYLLFVALILLMVVASMRQNVDLVSREYYAEEISYQQHLEALENGKSQAPSCRFSPEHQGMEILFSETTLQNLDSARIYFYCPSDEQKDFSERISRTTPQPLMYPLSRFKSNSYRLKIDWYQQGKTFATEQTLTIPR